MSSATDVLDQIVPSEVTAGPQGYQSLARRVASERTGVVIFYRVEEDDAGGFVGHAINLTGAISQAESIAELDEMMADACLSIIDAYQLRGERPPFVEQSPRPRDRVIILGSDGGTSK